MSEHLPILGLSKDTEPQNQPANTYRFALNMVHDSVDGSQGAVVNENSNRLCVELDGNVCGIIAMNNTYQVVFTDSGCIYKVDTARCTANLLVQIAAFNFSQDSPITGEYRVVRGCEDVIYWRDSVNPDRWCNLTTLEQYPDRFTTVNDFSLNPEVGYPDVATELLTSGGKLDYGTYSFVVEILDENQNVVLRSIPSEPVAIGPGLNLSNSTAEEGALPASNNSIKVTLSNLDTRFNYFRLAVIRTLTSDGITSDAHYIGEVTPYSSVKQSYVYRGFNTSNGDFLIDKNEVLVPFVVYDTSKVMEQVQGRLVRANLTEQNVDYSTFQRYASKICTKYVVTEIEPTERSEQGDEVKAYGIVYVFRNGTISPVFHIPGRGKLPHDEQLITTTLVTPPVQEDVVSSELTFSLVGVRTGSNYALEYFFSQDIAQAVLTLCSSSGCENINVGTVGSAVITLGGTEDFVELVIQATTTGGESFLLSTGVNFPVDDTFTLEGQGAAGTTTENWQLNNTAVKDTTPDTGYVSSGLMGYYEVANTYSNPVNFCGTDYWGSDCNGNALAGTPIRHHRIPCRTIEPLSSGSKPRYIGVKFTNVEYPHPDIVGHYFVSSTRDETNSTVIASGYMLPYNYAEPGEDTINGRYIHYLPQAPDNFSPENSTLQNLITNEFLFDGKVIQGDFVKINGYYQSSYEQNRKEGNDAYKKIFLSSLPFDNLELYGKHHDTVGFVAASEFIGIDRSVYLPSKSLVDDIPNRSFTSNFNVLTLDEEPSTFAANRANLNYVYVKSSVPVHNNLSAIRYRILSKRLHNEDSEAGIFNGDVFISKLTLTNISWLAVGNLSATELLQYFIPIVGPGLLLFDLLNDSDKDVKVEYELIENLWIESNHRLSYRHQGETCNRFYDVTTNQSIDDFIINKVAELAEPDEDKRRYRLRSSFCPEWYGYNSDYSRINDFRVFRQLAYTYNFCSECLNRYPNRLIWSEKSFEEDISDRYRVYKANNYFDNTPHRGEITGVTYKNSVMLLRTEESSFILQPNPQQLQADGTNIYIGTGDFLSIPPYEMSSTDLGYGGQQGVLAHANTPHGLIWVDIRRGKVFSYAQEFEEISRYKLYHWFEQNLKSFLTEDFLAYGFTPNFDQVRVAYDSKFERTIIHKTDYSFTDTLKQEISKKNVRQSGGKLVLRSKSPHVQNSASQVLEYNNPVFFVNKSFTISYSHRTKTWISWHSYQPEFMLTSSNTFGTTLGNKIYLHDDYYTFGKFFDKEWPSVIELVDNALITQNPHALHYYAQAQKWEEGQWIDANDVTYTGALIYNRNQSTGLVQLVAPGAIGTLGWSNTIKPVVQKDKNFKIAQIRDIAINSPVNTSSWDVLQDWYDEGQGYMDIAPRVASLDFNKPMYQLNELRDKYAIVRLYFDNSDYKLTTHLIQMTNIQSVR